MRRGEMPVLFICTGKPSSADVASIVYARQLHSRTARFQLNVVTAAHPPRIDQHRKTSSTGVSRGRWVRFPAITSLPSRSIETAGM
jgi:hypothetical protein